MPLRIVRDDLANCWADAVVLPSNERLVIDGGAGYAVAKKAGLLRVRLACRRLRGCAVGKAVATPAFSFPAKHLIHAVGPVWHATEHDAELLRSAYDSALRLAKQLKCESVVVPLLSAGTFGCPAHVSLSIALSSIEDFLADSDMKVTLVLFSKKAVAAGLDFLGDLESRIDDAYAEAYGSYTNRAYRMPAASMPDAAPWADYLPENIPFQGAGAAPSYGQPVMGMPGARGSAKGAAADAAMAPDTTGSMGMPLSDMECASASVGLEERIDNMDEGFSQALLALIDESGMTDAQVYRRANMSRQHFSKIRSNVGYHPKKATVLALCVALQLDLDQTRDLLERAGFALSHADKFDIIVEYFIEHGEYDPFKINETLFYFDQPLLG